jgi:exonuclease VII small subunit
VARKNEAMDHLAHARQQLQQALEEAKGVEPPDGPRTPLRKEGEATSR